MNRSTQAAIGVAIALGAAAFAPAHAESVRLDYAIRLGGFTAGAVRIDLQLEADHYRMQARTESRGFIDALIGFRSDARSTGTRRGAEVEPVAHEADNLWRGEPRRVRIGWRSGEIVLAEATPPPELDDRSPVPEALLAGTLDPLSAALRAALAAEAGRPCEGRLDIFDGRRRYALHFEDRRQDADALRCRVRLERIAGMSRDPWLPILRPIETAELWLGSVGRDLSPTPVKLQADTAFGSAIVQLVAVDGEPR